MNPPSFTPGAVNLGYSAQGQPGICRIPNCNKPVWKDPRTGKESPYCGNTCRKQVTFKVDVHVTDVDAQECYQYNGVFGAYCLPAVPC